MDERVPVAFTEAQTNPFIGEITDFISSLDGKRSFEPAGEVFGNQDHLYDFKSTVKLARIHHLLGKNTKQLDADVREKRYRYKQELLEYGDPISALDIEGRYISYLYGIGAKKEAVSIARDLKRSVPPKFIPSDGSELEKKISDSMKLGLYHIEYFSIQTDVRLDLLKDGRFSEANAILSKNKELVFGEDFGLRGEEFEYFAGQGNVDELARLETFYDRGFNITDELHTHFSLETALPKIRKYLALAHAKNGDFDDSIDVIGRLPPDGAERFRTAIMVAEKAYEAGDHEQFNRFFDYALTEGRNYYDWVIQNAEDDGYNGNVDLSLQIVAANILNIMKLVENNSSFQDIYSRCLDGGDPFEPEPLSLVDIVGRLGTWESITDFWGEIFQSLARKNDIKTLDMYYNCFETYYRTWPDFSGRIDWFTAEYAHALSLIDDKEVNAIELLRELPDSPKKTQTLRKVIFDHFRAIPTLAGWESMIGLLHDWEKKVMPKQKPLRDIESLFSGMPDDSEEFPDNGEEHFVSNIPLGGYTATLAFGASGGSGCERSAYSAAYRTVVPDLLADLAQLACEKKDIQSFRQIMSGELLEEGMVWDDGHRIEVAKNVLENIFNHKPFSYNKSYFIAGYAVRGK